MTSEASVVELRASVKKWEREFEASEGRKPTSSDAKAHASIWALYQKYRAVKKATSAQSSSNASLSSTKQNKPEGPSTPQKRKPEPNNESDTEEDEEGTPATQKVTEVFPTPQFRGKVLGLFDVKLDLMQTPQKPESQSNLGTPSRTTLDMHTSPLSSSPGPHTPSHTHITETPQSKRTPEYFAHRVNLFPQLTSGPLFPASDAGVAESPLIKRKVSKVKPVSEIIREADEITESSRSSSILDDGSSSESESEVPTDLPLAKDPNVLDMAPNFNDNSNSRRKPKRQTRRVVMRPVEQGSGVSNSKATDNFVRLKINKNKKFRRR